MSYGSETSEWQSEARRCNVVLSEVFSWLDGRGLACAGAVCRAWRRAAAEPSLWRRLVLSERLAEPLALVNLSSPHADTDGVCWRQEYVTARAGWRLDARHKPAGGAALLHAALSPEHDVIAIGADDASLAIWRYFGGTWREVYRTELRGRGWAGVTRVEWARQTPRLLLAGPRVLIDDWELMVLCLDDDYSGATVSSRVRCSPGGAGCWADRDGDTFLSLELHLLAPTLACTTVRLNAATQETQSEYAGVTTPLLRIFNEDQAHITLVIVATLPDGRRVLLTSAGPRLASWPVVEPRPPPLLVGAPGELAARVLRRRARAQLPDEEPPAPDEAAVRALCSPPAAECWLTAAIVGLVLDDDARTVWLTCSDGSVSRVCACTLSLLVCVRDVSERAPAHYVQPHVTHLYVTSPEGAYSPRVWVWSLRSGAASQCGGGKARGFRSKQDSFTNGLDRNSNGIHGTDREDGNVQHNGNNGEADGNDEQLGNHERDGENNGNIEPSNDSDDVGNRDSNNAAPSDGRNANHSEDSGNVGGGVNAINSGDSGGRSLEVKSDIVQASTSKGFGDATDNNSDIKDEVKKSCDNDNVIRNHEEASNDGLRNSSNFDRASISNSFVDESYNLDDDNRKFEDTDYNNNGGNYLYDGKGATHNLEDQSNIDQGPSSSLYKNTEGNFDLVCDSNNNDNSESELRDNGDTERPGSSYSFEDRKRLSLEVCEKSRDSERDVQHSGAAVCALLPRVDPDSLLVLASDTLYVWRRRVPQQSLPNLFYD